jgi:hypothetical protein
MNSERAVDHLVGLHQGDARSVIFRATILLCPILVWPSGG